ncbi:hypothetical protein N431DRAFT_327149 [Stipitochalara longipes BDJ]|nr:hypothetical protein N431DRAFT_327149 [Stipitochalara longipes BDJ]
MFLDVKVLGLLILLSTQVPSSAASALFADSICAKLEKASGWQAAYNYHLKCKNYQTTYFKPTFDKVMPMALGSWYSETISRIYEENPRYRNENLTEVEVFAKSMSGDGDFHCGILESSCNRKFTPRQIIDHLADMHTDWNPQTLIEEAQKVTFALDFIETINKLHFTSSPENFIANVIRKLLEVVQTNQGQLAGDIIRHFTNQKNRESIELCHFKEKMLAWGISFIENLMFFGWAQISFPGVSPAGGKVLSAMSNIIQSVMQFERHMIEILVEHAQLDAEDAWEAAKKNGTSELMLEIPYSVGLCGEVGGNYEPKNWENQASMEHYVQKLFMDMRSEVERGLRVTMRGFWDGGPVTVHKKSLIAYYLNQPEAFQWYERLKHDSTGYEKNMTIHFANVLQSASLVSDKCYLKCIRDPKQKRKVEKCNPKDWWNRESRFCPADDEHVICQLECLTLQDKKNHLKKPPGVDQTKEWYGIGQTAIAEASWRHRMRKGTNKYEDQKALVANGILELDARLNSGVPPFSLPVSISEYGSLAEFDNTVDVKDSRITVNQQFPCISGDWTGSGTVDFMNRLGLGIYGKDVVSGSARELIEEICPRNFQALPPATHYFATCGIGVQYPKQDFMRKALKDYYYKIENGASEHCGALLKKARENNMTEGEGNYHFCKESPLFKKVLRDENHSGGRVLVPVEKAPWLGQATRWRCEHWLRLYEKEWKKAGVKNSSDVRRLEDAGRRFPMER